MKKERLELNLDVKKAIVEKIRSYFREELDEEIGDLKAELLYDFMKRTIGKEFYNLGVLDTRRFLLKKIEDLEVDLDQIYV